MSEVSQDLTFIDRVLSAYLSLLNPWLVDVF